MPKLEKDTNLYAEFERICPVLKDKGMNLTADAVASALVNSILNDALDEAGKAKQNIEGLSWLMEDEQKGVRKTIRDRIKPCITAAKNYQNSYLEPSGLMPKAETVQESVDLL